VEIIYRLLLCNLIMMLCTALSINSVGGYVSGVRGWVVLFFLWPLLVILIWTRK